MFSAGVKTALPSLSPEVLGRLPDAVPGGPMNRLFTYFVVGSMVLGVAAGLVITSGAGLVDLGPAIGLWYLAVTVQMWRSLRWARERREAAMDPP